MNLMPQFSVSVNILRHSLQVCFSKLIFCIELECNETISLLPFRMNVVRDVFDLSESANLEAPSAPILLPVLSENELMLKVLPLQSYVARDEFDLSTSDNLIAPSSPISLAVLCENEMQQQVCNR
jgi:hypothetical protein